jgi:hypothetical protein
MMGGRSADGSWAQRGAAASKTQIEKWQNERVTAPPGMVESEMKEVMSVMQGGSHGQREYLSSGEIASV